MRAGVKQGLGLLSRYLYVVTDDTTPDGATRSQLQVLDVKNKLVAGEMQFWEWLWLFALLRPLRAARSMGCGQRRRA